MIAKMQWEDLSGERPVKYSRGDSIPDDHPKREWLLRWKIAAAEVEVAEQVDEPVVEPVAEQVDEPVVEPVQAKNRPSRSAGIDDWRLFAQSKRIDTKGLSKQEIIAATQ